jgi:alkylhydroperoxidase/carboxymuconolactone decarboxylase family protein YurZ
MTNTRTEQNTEEFKADVKDFIPAYGITNILKRTAGMQSKAKLREVIYAGVVVAYQVASVTGIVLGLEKILS